ncbi:MAG: ABC-type transport auxiliary lipoprotein family protein [Gammaproteobacteria bacterium]
MKNIIKLTTCIMIVFLLMACSPVKLPNPETYQLAPSIPNSSTSPQGLGQTVLVSIPQVAAGYNTQKMAYMQQPFQVGYFTKNQWVDDPGAMLQPLMVEALQNSHYFHAVTGAPFSGVTDLRLDTTVIMLRQDFLVNPSQSELAVSAQLVQSSTQRIIAGKRFSITVPTVSNTPYGGVQAANQATTLFLQQLTQFVTANAE